MIRIVRMDGEKFETNSLSYEKAVGLLRNPDAIFDIVGRPSRATAIEPFPLAIRSSQVIAIENFS